MNDERLRQTVGSWLRDEDAAPPDSLHSARQVAARVSKVRQQSRWWPLPLLRRSPAAPAVIPDTDLLLPDPTPATNGHTPTVIGRTQSMFSPVKAVTAGALVFALGGVLFIAQPFDQQGSVPAAEQGAEPGPEAATLVSGQLLDTAQLENCGDADFADVTQGEGYLRERGRVCGGRAETSDPRLSGEVTFMDDADRYIPGLSPDDANPYLLVGPDFSDVFWGSVTIENDGGLWEGRSVGTSDITNDGSGIAYHELVGSGAYEGLSAVLFMLEGNPVEDETVLRLTGVIFPGVLSDDR